MESPEEKFMCQNNFHALIFRPSQIPQKISPVGPRRQRTTSSSESDHKTNTERSPNLIMRGSLSDPLGQKKLGTRVSCLETQLIQAQKELKNLKQQLSSAEVTKKEDQIDLQKKSKKNPSTNKQQLEHQGKCTMPKEEAQEENHKEMDVFEVPMQETIDSKPELKVNLCSPDESKDHPLNEIEQLKAELEAKDKELELAVQEKETLKTQLNEANAEISAAQIKEEERILKYSQLERDLEASKATNLELKEKAEALLAAKEELGAEMKKLRIQTEQWRKAADAAASVLAGSADNDLVRVSGRRGSMDKHFNGVFEQPLSSGYPGFLGSEGADDLDDGYGGKIKGSVGIRMFGDLWKKKGQK
ncbi:hypothetical protein V2J09_015274 [Rumex salicifolius]